MSNTFACPRELGGKIREILDGTNWDNLRDDLKAAMCEPAQEESASAGWRPVAGSEGQWFDGSMQLSPDNQWFYIVPHPPLAKPKTVTRKVWINIDSDEFTDSFSSKYEADKYKNSDRIACIEREITYVEGEGLP